MHEQIMNTINHFYKDEENGMEGLKCGIKDSMDINDPSIGGSRYHGICLEPFMNPDRHVLWVDVPDYEDKQLIGSTSRTNKAEAEAVALVIKALKKADGFDKYIASQVAKEDKEIGIITFYGAQAAILEEMKKNGKLDSSLSYRINVVDKFQGMERNIVIISTVRNNSNNDFGFTSDPRRINVGFSRAKSLLIIVGNRSFLSKNADYAKAISAIGNNRIDVRTLKHLVK
jgi:superfamily I DNA and/or RNA helicase